jgi:hypothetical protein
VWSEEAQAGGRTRTYEGIVSVVSVIDALLGRVYSKKQTMGQGQRRISMPPVKGSQRPSVRGLLFTLMGLVGIIAASGCASSSEEMAGQQQQQQNLQREISALRADVNSIQRDTQARLLILERETKTAIDQTKEKEKSASSSRRIEAETAELKRAVDRYADKTKQMLASLIQAFVDAANDLQVENPQKAEETPHRDQMQRDVEDAFAVSTR